MSDAPGQRTNLPAHGAKIEPRGHYLALGFHPSIRLDRKKGFEYAATLSDYIDPSDVSLDPQAWTFSQPVGRSPRSHLRVRVTPSEIQIHADFPTHVKEWFEDRQLAVLEKFKESFDPQLILYSMAMIRGSLSIDGDARVFLAQHVMNIDPERMRPFGRPVHVVGLRFSFPPFRRKIDAGAEITDWLVEVKAESLAEDPSRLFLEADAKWPEPLPWNKENLATVVGRTATVSRYLEQNVTEFLQRATHGGAEAD